MTRPLAFLVATILAASLHAEQSPLIGITLGPITRSVDLKTATVLATLRNYSGADVTGVDVDLTLSSTRPTDLTAGSHPAWPPDWSCQSTGAQKVRCRLPLIRGTEGGFVPLVISFSPADEGRFSLVAQAAWTVGAVTWESAPYQEFAFWPRSVIVSNTRDEGEGSLRAAIDYANEICARDMVPCALQFQFAEALPQQGWYPIRPLTPLPAITAPDFSLERENDAPAVELDGSLLTAGHGLELRGNGPAIVDSLSIGGFPWDGVSITRRGGTGVYRSSVGVRPDGSTNPNGSRGVTIDAPAADVTLWSSSVRANVRSGVFIAGGERIRLDFNSIGRLSYQGPEFRNGASGVFVGPDARDVVISTSYVGGNAHMGVAVARGARGVRVLNTWVAGSSGLMIDHALDGFSGHSWTSSAFALPAPRIATVSYDATTNTTTVTGTFDAPDAAQNWVLTLYTDDLGIWPERNLPTHAFSGTTFNATLPGRTAWVRATVSGPESSDWSTSEFSEAAGVGLLATRSEGVAGKDF